MNDQYENSRYSPESPRVVQDFFGTRAKLSQNRPTDLWTSNKRLPSATKEMMFVSAKRSAESLSTSLTGVQVCEKGRV